MPSLCYHTLDGVQMRFRFILEALSQRQHLFLFLVTYQLTFISVTFISVTRSFAFIALLVSLVRLLTLIKVTRSFAFIAQVKCVCNHLFGQLLKRLSLELYAALLQLWRSSVAALLQRLSLELYAALLQLWCSSVAALLQRLSLELHHTHLTVQGSLALLH
jgi:hypothetical protein